MVEQAVMMRTAHFEIKYGICEGISPSDHLKSTLDRDGDPTGRNSFFKDSEIDIGLRTNAII